MRNYLYRAKKLSDGNMIEGYVSSNESCSNYYIISIDSAEKIEVQKNSIAKMLDLSMQNKNQETIFELDKIKFMDKIFEIKYVPNMCSYMGIYVDPTTKMEFFQTVTSLLKGEYLGYYK